MNPDQTPAHLPAPLPPTAALLHRAQGTLGLLREVVQESSAEYWYERGKEAMTREEWKEAHGAFERCLSLNKLYWQAQLQLSQIKIKWPWNTFDAVTLLLEAYNCPYPYWEKFTQELTTKQWNDLDAAFSSYCHYECRDDFEILVAWSITNQIQENDEAQDRLKKIEQLHIDKAKNSAIWYQVLGFQHYQKKDFENAISCFSDAIATDVNYAWAYVMRGMARGNEDCQATLADLDRAIELQPENAAAYFFKGVIKDEEGKYLEALYAYDRAICLAPDYIQAYEQRAEVKSTLLDDEGAILDYNHLINFNSREATYYVGRGVAKWNCIDWEGALADLDTAVILAPGLRPAYYYRGKIREQLGDKEGAELDKKMALTLYYASHK